MVTPATTLTRPHPRLVSRGWDAGSWRATLAVSAAATGLGLVIALAGARATEPGVSPWPRFWATAYFVLLLWPVGLGLAGRLAGLRTQGAAAALLVALSLAQQFGIGSMPLPSGVRWAATLSQPGDAIRQRILLPGPGDRAWQRAWRQAAYAAVAICTWEAVAPEAGIGVTVNGGAPVPLDSLPRGGQPDGWGWYALRLTRPEVEAARQLEVVVGRGRAEGPPARVCGGKDDPARPGAGGAARWLNGRWTPDDLADQPLPPVEGRPAPGRYYVEVRFFDAGGHPSAGIWY